MCSNSVPFVPGLSAHQHLPGSWRLRACRTSWQCPTAYCLQEDSDAPSKKTFIINILSDLKPFSLLPRSFFLWGSGPASSLTFSGAPAARRRFTTSALPFSAAPCSAVSPRCGVFSASLRKAVADVGSTLRPPAVDVGRRDVGVALQQKVHDGRVGPTVVGLGDVGRQDQRRFVEASGRTTERPQRSQRATALRGPGPDSSISLRSAGFWRRWCRTTRSWPRVAAHQMSSPPRCHMRCLTVSLCWQT